MSASRPRPQGTRDEPQEPDPAPRAAAARPEKPGEPPGDTALLHALLDGMDVALCAFDAEGTVTHWNVEAEKVLGWTPEEAVGRRGLAGWAARSTDSAAVEGEILGVLAEPERRVHEFPLVTKDGRRVLVRSQSAPVFGADGVPRGVYCAFSEVHAQIELERSIALSEALFDDSPWGVVLIDADLRPVVVNETASRWLRADRDAVLGRPLGDLLRDGLEDIENTVQHVLAEGTARSQVEVWVSLRDDDADGRRCWRGSFLRLGSPLGHEPVPLGVAWMFLDVTESREEEREASRLRFRATQLRRAAQAAAECENPLEAATVHLDFALAGFADHALVDTVAGEGRLVRVAATPEGASGPCAPVEPAGIPVRYSEWHPVLQAVQRRGSVRTSAGRLATTGADRQASWARARRWPEDTVHALCAVLRSRGATLGVVTFLRGPSRGPFDRADAAYAEDVAVRVAAALDLGRRTGTGTGAPGRG